MNPATQSPRSAGEFRLTDGQVAKDPGEYFEELRTQCPVAHSESFDGFWVLSRHEDVNGAALKDQEFSSASGITIPVINQPPVICIGQDDPEHRKYRRPLQGWFSAKRVNALEDQVRSIVTECLDGEVEKGEGDLSALLASPVPPIVIALILGLPREDWDWFRERETEMLTCSQRGDAEGALKAVMDVHGYLGKELELRRQTPAEDMLTDIVQLEIDGEPITQENAVSLAFLILGAGHETTVGGIGGLLYQVAKDPALRDELLADPSLVDNAVEEALRLEAPLMGLGRNTRNEVEVDGVSIPAGEWVMLLFGAANRDPEVFDDPESFRLDRENVQEHLAIGAGVHRCVGAPLARLEMKVVLEEVLRRMPRVQLVDPEAVEVRWTVGRDFQGLHATW